MTPLQAIRAIAALIPKEGDLPEWAKIAQKVSKDHEGLPYFPGEPDWFDDESAIAELLAADVLFSDSRRMNAKERLLSERDPEQEGTWTILGEYENPDIFGSKRPLLEVVKGRYKDAVDFALAHPRFFTWGSGGVILRGIRKGRTPKVLASKSLFEDLQRKVDMEGLDYIGSLPDTFIKNVQDPKFHQLYSAYIEAAEDLKAYIHEKAKNST